MAQTRLRGDTLPDLTEFVFQLREGMLQAIQSLQFELNQVTGKIVTLEEIQVVMEDSEILKEDLREMPEQFAELQAEIDENTRKLDLVQGELRRLLMNEARGLTGGTKEDRQAQALDTLLSDSPEYRGLAGQETELEIADARLNTQMLEMKAKDKNLGREVQLVVAQLGLLASQVTSLGGNHK